MALDDIRNTRLGKLKILQDKGIDPYPATVRRDKEIAEVVGSFSKLSKSKKNLHLVGRVMSLRPQGGLVFFHFDDGTGRLQGMLKKGEKVSDEDFSLFVDTVDVGDFVEVKGALFLTKKKEKTVQVSNWRMICKSLRPLPEKWHGLQDIEERFRRRYLDTLMNEEVRNRFLLRVRMMGEIRNFYNSKGFIEVELPELQPLAGGATARPFVTHHNTLDTDFYLPVAQELYLKELLAGGFTRVYEMGRRFRNEGVDTMHNPEFTMLESNEAYVDAEDQRKFIEELFKYVVKKLFGKMKVVYSGNTIDFGKKFAVVTYFDLLRRNALIPNPESINREEVAIRAHQLAVPVLDDDSLPKILDNIYKKTARPKLIQPTFIIDYPVTFNPFAKRKGDNPSLIDRFQLVVGGIELVNAFSELNNSLDQKERYLEEDKKGEAGEAEISPSDKEYLEAMEYGMPPNGGIGIGIDRLAMILTDTQNIKEVILFPTLRPRPKEEKKEEGGEEGKE
ncbi:MAG: lysine--tRNA ligase [Candidatus Zambryskibacteria bacterium RIFCSPHIGHO2_01_FULL_43_25]|uniref:Lysine--tRNA ligase n=1 Tax=Candidatus Zambryskibacteria bacterium RIFCSPLOWO2_01_FULL_45_21 TaxID=1802761 RepID=A0A1G2U337_9BACT|nr:MAG: lysine--tRNA ligase [Candidatus Zambryskibacteria bacterium RIFCSPHIGHO2_01_FULL_43_25]OHB03935.1 MAG: lysine--tRNA ligase [Candidatus Zambryskibacteria bacterium RIFCSPLOWO2_01_FULL_45_21]